jgi:glycosyltransferase involved in cell wall biosynthesis
VRQETAAAVAASGVREARRHICIVTETYPPDINGVALTLARLVAGLRAHGHVVSVVHPHRRPFGRPGDPPDPAVTLVRSAPVPGYRGVLMGWPAARVLRKRWTRHCPDVAYVATEGPLGWSAVRVARRLGIPVFSGFHTNFHGYAKHYHAGWLRPVIARYLRRFHNRTLGTIVPSPDLRDRLRAAGFRNLSVIARGVDCHLFDPARRSDTLRRAWGVSGHDLVALYVGRVAPEKNVRLAIQAYRTMQGAGTVRRFVVVGDGPLRAALQREHPDLLFCGVHTGESLAAHYASADVFLFPSETETFGNVTLEAMASGLAVVAYDYAAARAHITDGETGVLVSWGDDRAFVEAATILARSPATLSRMRRQARAHAAAVDWHHVVRRFETLLTGEEEVRNADE